jgi:glucose/arabinose dehydrogenase
MLTLIRRLAALGLAAGLVAAPRPAAALLTGLPTGFVDELVVGGLPFPTAVAFTPDGRMLVALKRGEVRMYQGTTLVGTFIDINTIVHDNHDRGLLGLAVHPDCVNIATQLVGVRRPHGMYQLQWRMSVVTMSPETPWL